MRSDITIQILIALVLLTPIGCSRNSSPQEDLAQREALLKSYEPVALDCSPSIFMGGVITPTPSSGEFLVIIELSPAEHEDADRLCKVLRSGKTVSVRLRCDKTSAHVVIENITNGGEIIVRCKTLSEAKNVIALFKAYPS